MSASLRPRAPLGIEIGDVFRVSPNAYMILDRELRYVAANEAYLTVTGSRLDELIGTYVFERFPNDPDDPDNEPQRILRASFERVFATRRADFLAMIAYRMPMERDGQVVVTERFWSASHTPLLDASGEVVALLQHTVDVTELHTLRRAARAAVANGAAETPEHEARLEQAEAGVIGHAHQVQQANTSLAAERMHLLSLVEQSPGFTAFMRGPEHVFELANPAFNEMVGQPELLGKPIRVALPGLEERFHDVIDRVYQTGVPYVGRGLRGVFRRVPRGPLEEVVFDQVFQPILDTNGAVIGILAQGQDRTEEHRLRSEHDELFARERHAREEAERANLLKDQFLATVSHELRTPLTAMLGWVQMLRSGQLATEERRERALETIERNARAQAQLVEDLLDVGRIMSGKLQLQLEPVALGPVVEAAIESCRPSAAAKGVELVSHLAEGSGSVMGDPGRIQQVAGNLLANAIKFTPGGRRVTISLLRGPGCINLVVSDEGEGISADFLPHVFEPFRQAEGSFARRHGGLGLGLAIVKNIVELHNATIAVTSDGLGRGATFTVGFPVSVARISQGRFSPAVRPSKLAATQELVGIKVLVVDDEEDTRELLRALLERNGASVETASSAGEALEILARALPDALLSDIGMPGEDGYGLIKRIRALPDAAGRVPAVALTAYVRPEDRARALRAGFGAHVSKPIDARELVATLVRLARGASGR